MKYKKTVACIVIVLAGYAVMLSIFIPNIGVLSKTMFWFDVALLSVAAVGAIWLTGKIFFEESNVH